ncbi:molybdate ABC transporter substrate-binding protein [Primorskyibacter sp. S87]|uniref:molybdate ABC transporter substrate-binding protein n=1 Tax=Primorskyibacter sp. S87 TaxID=3415126 RepID=UPI003C7D4E91
MKSRFFFLILIRRQLTVLALLLTCFAGTTAAAEPVTVFAAASLKGALEDIAKKFEDQSGHTVTISLAGSSSLARQIGLGAPADIFISANTGWMDWLECQNRIAPDTRFDMVENRLVLIGSNPETPVLGQLTPDFDPAALLDGGYLAMALVDAVPAGIYGKAALTHFGLWDSVAGQVAQADNVRAALALVASGEAPLGIVYETDAAADPRVRILGTFPADSHPRIRFPAAMVSGQHTAAAQSLLAFLASDDARSILTHHGFLPPKE